MAIPRAKMPEQNPKTRAANFEEVPLGLSPEIAMRESVRCLSCRKKPCVGGCPVGVQIPEFLDLVSVGKFVEAARMIKETNVLPAVTGRVCPQESQCEGACTLFKKYGGVSIGALERFVADYERTNNLVKIPKKPKSSGKKVAVIGSGPSGLTVAGDLILEGHAVTVFEALHEAGGVLVYGIPEFRLPKEIVSAEVDYLEKQGVNFQMNIVAGLTVPMNELLEEYDAVYIGVGAGLPSFMRIEGEELNGVFSANEYLTRSNLMKGYLFPEYDSPLPPGKHTCVVGGGNVAMDSARTARRLGAEVSIVYRRAREQLPARGEEVHHAEEEGIDFQLLTNPVRIFGEDGKVTGMECIRMELGEPDDSGRRRPIPIEGSNFEFECDQVIISIGAGANPLLINTMPDLELNRWGYIEVDKNNRTSVDRVWAGGDIVTGAATVIEAMGAGRIAARSIQAYLTGQPQPGTENDQEESE
ncbi:MAG: NADPH-dependent glutamate synthase [Candidatus Thorarchaeota archaeon]|nr:MAG: NADPH-dependent glutamate synthase [Candidatus Thorarchaeota archaeon]